MLMTRLPAKLEKMSEDLSLRIRTVTLLLAASSLLSRILGYGRDWLITTNFGANGQTDVYQASFTLPDMLNYLLAGGALTVSLLPRMSALYAAEKEGVDRDVSGLSAGDRAFSIVFTAMTTVTLLLVVIAEFCAEPIIAAWFPGFSPQMVSDTAHLTRIVLPAQLFFLAGGLVQATLLARQSFAAMALTPLFYNGGIIVGGLVGSHLGDIEGFSWGALGGGLVGGLVIPAWSARGKLHFRVIWRPFDPEIRNFLWTALPLMIGVSLTTVDEWLGKRYGSQLLAGSITWLMTARRIMLVPIGLLGQAAGQATGSFIAKLHAEGQREQLAEVLASSAAAVVGLSLVFSAFLCAMAEPTVTLLFQHGKFGVSDSIQTARALVPLSVGIAAWGAQAVVARAFYGTGDTWRPMIATTVVTIGMLPVYAEGAARLGNVGLALAGSFGMTIQVVVLLILARQRLGFAALAFLRQIGKAAGVAFAAAMAIVAVDSACFPALPSMYATSGWAAARLVVAGATWACVVIPMGAAVGMPGIPSVFLRVLSRFKLANAEQQPT